MSTDSKHFFPIGFQPSDKDVVVGRHKMARDHAGNIRFNEIIDSYRADYQLAEEKKARKSEILAEIYAKVHNENGRFVKLDSKEQKWYEVTKSVARERISQGFRDR
jgi:hypothetical protein